VRNGRKKTSITKRPPFFDFLTPRLEQAEKYWNIRPDTNEPGDAFRTLSPCRPFLHTNSLPLIAWSPNIPKPLSIAEWMELERVTHTIEYFHFWQCAFVLRDGSPDLIDLNLYRR
jgi:hypothetical protein